MLVHKDDLAIPLCKWSEHIWRLCCYVIMRGQVKQKRQCTKCRRIIFTELPKLSKEEV